MKKITIIALLIIGQCFYAQNTDAQLVKQTLLNYIEGTTNGNIKQIEKAFFPNAELYATNDNNDGIKIIPIKKYLTYFNEGEPTGRKGTITFTEIVGDAATAIIEVDMSSRKYTDFLLLLKLNGKWKILKKSYTREAFTRKGEVLFAISETSKYADTNYKTGAHFYEIVEVYHQLVKNGYEVDVVSPTGTSIPVSYIDLSDSLQKKYFYNTKFMQKLKQPLKPSEIVASNYEAVYFPGGGAAMFDLPNNKEIIEITRKIYEENNGIVAALCHGPAGLVNVKLKNGTYLVDGKHIISYTNKEEDRSSKKQFLPFLLETKLMDRGAKFAKSNVGKEKVIVDDRLLTGQNPNSAKKFSQMFLNLLKHKQ